MEIAKSQDDWEGYAKLTANTAIQIVGDDLLVTNPNRWDNFLLEILMEIFVATLKRWKQFNSILGINMTTLITEFPLLSRRRHATDSS